MKITIIAIGKLKESYLKGAQAEYLKRLSAYAKTNIIELKDERLEVSSGTALQTQALEAEGKRILKAIPDNTFVIVLDLKGVALTSEDLAAKIDACAASGNSHFTFIVGGSIGLAETVKARADLSLSFSKLTFPHQLFRIMLLEQIYRSFKIIRGETYHK